MQKILPASKYLRWSSVATLATGSLLVATDSRAVGFRQPNQDPEAIARGNAFVATADNPSAIYYNPAGITQIEGQQARVGLYAVSTGNDYTSPTGQTARADDAYQPIPQLYYVHSLKDLPLSFGLGAYVPYGLSVDYGKDNPFRTIAQEGKLLYMTLNPVVAWKVHETFSIGIGPEFSYSQADFRQGIFVPGDEFRFKGDGVGYSFNAGVRWQPHEKLAFGANYRYLTTMTYEGHATTTPLPAILPGFFAPAYFERADASTSIQFPQSAGVGVSFRPTPQWNLEVNADWTDFDNVNQIAIQGPGVPPINLNYQSSWMYQFGVTRKFDGGWFVSTGYIWSENSSPDAGFHPLIPDSDLHLGSIGFGRRGQRWDWAFGYHFGYNPGRTVNGSQRSLAGETADGEYKILNHAFNVAATFKF